MRFDKLRLYRKSIGYTGDPKQLPPVFMSGYFNKALIAIGSSLFSRVRILGVVHLQQQVTVYRDLQFLMRHNFSATLISEEYRETSKGIQCTIRAGIYDLNDILVWEAIVTGVSVGPKKKSSNTTPQRQPKEFSVYKQEEIDAPANTGVDFANATQDYQPQHLYRWTAKLVGFKAPIAHGLWSMAVAVDRIMSSEPDSFQDRYPLHMDVSFKRPLVLPGKAVLQFEKPSGADCLTNFRMLNTRGNTPILVGSMHVGEARH
ncbi:dehydratase [Elysia marginata]|uniref:Dehydratase n=1 Tax=Elysia marginata TaxID=1093978 RepID=A0AAV4JBZ0_9GAST|nr:dehydratase [Elysia marginata]